MSKVLFILVCILWADLNAVAADGITIISFGRADQAALTQAYYRSFRKSTDIDVKTIDGVVTLTGVLGTPLAVKKAVAAAESIKGVKKVDHSGLKSQ